MNGSKMNAESPAFVPEAERRRNVWAKLAEMDSLHRYQLQQVLLRQTAEQQSLKHRLFLEYYGNLALRPVTCPEKLILNFPRQLVLLQCYEQTEEDYERGIVELQQQLDKDLECLQQQYIGDLKQAATDQRKEMAGLCSRHSDELQNLKREQCQEYLSELLAVHQQQLTDLKIRHNGDMRQLRSRQIGREFQARRTFELHVRDVREQLERNLHSLPDLEPILLLEPARYLQLRREARENRRQRLEKKASEGKRADGVKKEVEREVDGLLKQAGAGTPKSPKSDERYTKLPSLRTYDYSSAPIGVEAKLQKASSTPIQPPQGHKDGASYSSSQYKGQANTSPFHCQASYAGKGYGLGQSGPYSQYGRSYRHACCNGLNHMQSSPSYPCANFKNPYSMPYQQDASSPGGDLATGGGDEKLNVFHFNRNTTNWSGSNAGEGVLWATQSMERLQWSINGSMLPSVNAANPSLHNSVHQQAQSQHNCIPPNGNATQHIPNNDPRQRPAEGSSGDQLKREHQSFESEHEIHSVNDLKDPSGDPGLLNRGDTKQMNWDIEFPPLQR